MGKGASAIVVPRTRFAPVKKTSDLLLLRSDAYEISEDYRPILSPLCEGSAPVISLDSRLYKHVGQLEKATVSGVPSLAKCKRLTIKGKFLMSSKTTFVGTVTVINKSLEEKLLPEITIQDTTVECDYVMEII